ncbi:YnhF family membrane protein [Vibrio amylolyticus]|nr:YnhF family membrane protein [Vibrio sp. 10N.261.55.A7]
MEQDLKYALLIVTTVVAILAIFGVVVITH